MAGEKFSSRRRVGRRFAVDRSGGTNWKARKRAQQGDET
jgi:hypothetical protein